MGKLVKDMSPEEHERVKAYKRAHSKIYNKIYRKTEAGKKSYRIHDWKKRGVVYHDFDDLHDYVYNECSHCENCAHQFIDKDNKYRRCVDHCHETGEIRGIICHSCNVRRG